MSFDGSSLMSVLIPAGIILVAIFALGLIFARLYYRASKEIAFVRTGLGGEKVVRDGGALVLPVLHETIPVNMNTLRLEVRREKEAALITRDRMRVDVQAEFYVRVKPDASAISTAAQTLGRRTMEPTALKELVEGKFVDALRAVAAGMSMEELHENRADFAQKVQVAVSEDLHKNGLELESVSLTGLDQTAAEFFNPQNAFDAQGLTKLTQEIERRKKERNDIERDTKIQIEQKNLETEKLSLTIARDQEYARLMQDQEVKVRTAEATSEIARQEAERRREAEQAKIESDRAIAEAEIEKRRSVEQRDIERERAVRIAQQERQIAISKKSEEESAAKAQADAAFAKAVSAEEEVKTVRETATAERAKSVRLVQAREQAEQEAIGVVVSAEAEKKAAEDRAEAVRVAATGEAESVRIRATADAERYRVEAEGKRAINEARNALSEEQIRLEIRNELIRALPMILREAVKPMENIDGIKILDVRGLGGIGGGGAGDGSSSGAGAEGGNLARSVVDHALRYRAQRPLVDALLKEVGLGDMNDLSGLLGDVTTDPQPRPGKPS
ncbi:flotillin family protein [Solimonas sp. SE-A11]|uniref:flotillin family protein n=1 Tax=Solimonas sp. SE-A11 TaxID=3054954 RepID=UPI00259C9E38|nr:flotillin family protein [Solimonas sp. SE-A11]MDM4770321.1 flotillin family protein [Solimonas sp. SE-A11]